MEEENTSPFRRTSSHTRKMATKMTAALASTDNHNQSAMARLEALESDNAGIEVMEVNDDEYDSMDEVDDQVFGQKKQTKSSATKRKTRQAKALENAKRAPRSFMEVLHEANLESLPPHVPTYLKAAVGPPSPSSRRHFALFVEILRVILVLDVV
ncbi:hypothetical protein LUZ60_007804 [Juncus effusus]|nr:hypothetical protein LUZ60_007804 [Juncus effusus]